MSTVSLFEDSASRLAAQADAVGRLAQDPGGFAAAFAAFESRDPDAFRWVLDRLDIFPRCELICEWIQIKVCTLRCIAVCGPQLEVERPPTFAQFAQAVVRLAEDEALLRRAVDAVSCGDAEAWQAVLAKLKLQPFCYLLCRWVCSSFYRRFCHLVCFPHVAVLVDPVSELRAAAKVMAEVLKNQKAFEAIGKVAETLNCERTKAAIGKAGFGRHCEIICWVFCTWRCGWVCRELCLRPIPVLTGVHAIEEARAFALAARQLVSHPRVLFDLVTAVQGRDAQRYGAIVDRFGFHPLLPAAVQLGLLGRLHRILHLHLPRSGAAPLVHEGGVFRHLLGHRSAVGQDQQVPAVPQPGQWGRPELRVLRPRFAARRLLSLRVPRCLGRGDEVPLPLRRRGRPVADHRRPGQSRPGRDADWSNWPQNLAGIAGAALMPTFQNVQIVQAPAPPDPTPPVVGAAWFAPSAHYIAVDPDGWVEVDPDAIGGGFQTLLGFDTTEALVAPGGDPAPGVPAGTAVPVAAQRAGKDLAIIFQATRVTTLPPGTTPDFTNGLDKIHINNWTEVNELNFVEFVTGCCTPIDDTLSVQFTVDHEEMDAGDWSLGISSCSPSAPRDITPAASGPGVTVTARGGSGTIVLNTSTWTIAPTRCRSRPAPD